jgi:hypothetical protein
MSRIYSACRWDEKCLREFQMGNMKGKDDMGDLGVDGSTILEQI